MDKIDINVKQIHKQPFKRLDQSQLILEFKGKSVNCVLVNTFRRLASDYIPTFAMCRQSITIDKNTSVFDNDEMKLRLSQFTIPNVLINIPYLEDTYWENVDYANPNREKHPNDKMLLEMFVNATNDGDNIMNVTTNDALVFEDGLRVKKFDTEYPLLIIQLRTGQSFSCRAVNVLGIGKTNNIWAGTGNQYFKKVNDNSFELTLESQGQMDEYEILHKSCVVIKEKIKLIKSKLKHEEVSEEFLKIVLEGEDHTMGGIINTYLQDHKDVIFAGVNKHNFLIDTMEIIYKTSSKDTLKPFIETLDYVSNIADYLMDTFEKLGKEFILYNKVKKTK